MAGVIQFADIDWHRPEWPLYQRQGVAPAPKATFAFTQSRTDNAALCGKIVRQQRLISFDCGER